VVLATYNEVRFIESCLVSILSQETTNPVIGNFDIEVLAVDGLSTDGTRELLNRYAAGDARLRVLSNNRRRAPFAFNLGLRNARGEFVCIFGAHTVYRHDYIAQCLGELVRRRAAGCGGRVVTVPVGHTLPARLSAWTMSHPFGSSRKSFRTQREGPVDTVNYPVFRRNLVLAAGCYDEELLRNQDNDLNQKLRAAGHILWCTWKTQCLYSPQSTISGLIRYAFTNGFWNVCSLRKNPASMRVRHFIPLTFVLGLVGLWGLALIGASLQPLHMALALAPLVALLGLHLCLGTIAALQVSIRERSIAALWLPPVFLGFHISYGWGTLSGLIYSVWNTLDSSERAHRRSISQGN
jgi:GT2 family glycosyltransferase